MVSGERFRQPETDIKEETDFLQKDGRWMTVATMGEKDPGRHKCIFCNPLLYFAIRVCSMHEYAVNSRRGAVYL